MSHEITVSFGPASGTGAGVGTTGRHTVLADRPAGVAGGTGLGFNGAELLALAIGGCFWNDLHYAAASANATISVVRLKTDVTLAGTPPRVVRAHVHVWLSGAANNSLQAIFEAAFETSTIANSIAPAIPVTFDRYPAHD